MSSNPMDAFRLVKMIEDQGKRVYVKRWIRSVVGFPVLACALSILLECIVAAKLDLWFLVSNLVMLCANILLNTFALSEDAKEENEELREDTRYLSMIGVFICWIFHAFISGYTRNWTQRVTGLCIAFVIIAIPVVAFISYRAIVNGIWIRVGEYDAG